MNWFGKAKQTEVNELEFVYRQIEEQKQAAMNFATKHGHADFYPVVSSTDAHLRKEQLAWLTDGKGKLNYHLRRPHHSSRVSEPWFIFSVSFDRCGGDGAEEVATRLVAEGRSLLYVEEVIAWLSPELKKQREAKKKGEVLPLKLTLSYFPCLGDKVGNNWPIIVADLDEVTICRHRDPIGITNREPLILSAAFRHCFLLP